MKSKKIFSIIFFFMVLICVLLVINFTSKSPAVEIYERKDCDLSGKARVTCTIYYKDEDNDGQGIEGYSRCLCEPDEINKYTAIYSGDPDDLNPNVQGTILTTNISLPNGWSMFSLPLIPRNNSISDLFDEAIVIYGFKRGAGYVRMTKEDGFEIGNGYWILLNGAKTFTITGSVIDKYEFIVEAGWYLIGGCTLEAQASGTNCSIGVIYGYMPGVGYQRILETQNLEPGKGYWILLEKANVDDKGKGWLLVHGITYHERAIRDFAINSFERIRGVVDPGAETKPRVKFIGNHVEIASDNWVYVLDNTGRQTFRRTATYPHIKSSLSNDIGPNFDRWTEQPLSGSIIDNAKDLVLSTLGVDYVTNTNTKVFTGREVIASKHIDSNELKYHEGRTSLLFNYKELIYEGVKSYKTSISYTQDGLPIILNEPVILPNMSYESAVTFAPRGEVMRIESTFLTPEVSDIVNVFSEALMNGSIPGQIYDYDPYLNFGTFFQTEEYRFELTAFSYESKEFLNKNDPITNPYDLGPYPMIWCENDTTADVDFIITSPEYKKWAWDWWDMYGRVNGIRGNCLKLYPGLQSCQSWEKNNHKVIHHKKLRSYKVKYPVTGTLKNFKTCNGVVFPELPQSIGNKMEKQFYIDLEQCHAALIAAHGGFPGGINVYQFQKNWDIWVKLHEKGDDGLGKGNLRHLFLESCSSMNWIFGPKLGEYKNIESDWMNNHIADGIRTVCGSDSGYNGFDRGGWRFFGHYHRGESISQSWCNALIEECNCNYPVVIAYGSTLEQAAKTLFDGRFNKQRGGTGWIIAVEAWVIE